MEDLISIIVPVYNVYDYLKPCIDSILSQTYPFIEIILVDDGSEDNSGSICDSYCEQHDNISVIHKKNGGLSSARNAGIEIAQGSLIGFVDSDDYIEPTMYQILYETLKQNDADISVCGYYYGTKESYTMSHAIDAIYTSYEALKELLLDDVMNNYAWNKLFKKELFQSIRFPEQQIYEDVRIMHKLFIKAAIIASSKHHAYYYLIRNDSIIGKQKATLEVIHAFGLQTREVVEQYPEFSALVAYSMFIKYKLLYFEIKKFDKANDMLLQICKNGMKEEWENVKMCEDIHEKIKIKCFMIRYIPNIIYVLKRIRNSI